MDDEESIRKRGICMGQKNPCNCCSAESCEGCILNRFNKRFECQNDKCMENYEGTCLISIYDDCKAWKGVEANDQD